MSETCLSNGKLAAVIFGAILGTLLLCGVFLALLWQWLKKHKNDSKIFYVERAGKEHSKDIESNGHDSIDKSTVIQETKIEEQSNEKPVTQQSIVLNDKRYSNNFSQSNMGSPRVLPNLGVTIAKMPKNGFQIISVEKVESRFVPSDFITELSISLDQMSLEDAARLLELLVPYRIQLEVLRSSEEEEPPKVEKTSAEIHKEGPNESPEATNEVEGTDMPRLPSVSPPASPLPVDNRSPSQLPVPPSSGDEDQQQQQPRSARLATKIPTPKSARVSNRATLEPVTMTAKENDIEPFVRKSEANGYPPYSAKRDVLVVNSDETDEYGLTNEQYETLENNRRRLERERQSLRDMGILS